MQIYSHVTGLINVKQKNLNSSLSRSSKLPVTRTYNPGRRQTQTPNKPMWPDSCLQWKIFHFTRSPFFQWMESIAISQSVWHKSKWAGRKIDSHENVFAMCKPACCDTNLRIFIWNTQSCNICGILMVQFIVKIIHMYYREDKSLKRVFSKRYHNPLYLTDLHWLAI